MVATASRFVPEIQAYWPLLQLSHMAVDQRHFCVFDPEGKDKNMRHYHRQAMHLRWVSPDR